MTSGLTALLSSLVAAHSVNPSLVARGENEIATLIEGWARDAELETERLEEMPGRPSMLLAEPAKMGGASDAAFIAAAGIPTVLLGPGGEGAHAILSDTDAVARALVDLATRFCP
jgi:acetylornithine deacetylase